MVRLMKTKCPICNSNKYVKIWINIDSLQYSYCKNCQIIFQKDYQNKENDMDYGKSYYKNMYDFKFINRYIVDRKILARHYRAELNAEFLIECIKEHDLFRNSKKIKILDVGGGTGENLFYLINYIPNSQGIHMERSRIDKQVAKNLYNLEVISNFDDLDNNEKFDIITLHHVIEHIPNINEFIEILKNFLNDGGLLFITTPNPFSLYAKLRRKKWGWYIEDHPILYSPVACKKLLERHGLVLLKKKNYFLDSKNPLTDSLKLTFISLIFNKRLPPVLKDAFAQIYIYKR